MSHEPMLPCPFCGGEHLRVDELDEVFRAVECACGARGPVAGSEDEDEEFCRDYASAAARDAIARWNERVGARRG
jgi:hypothetical protein